MEKDYMKSDMWGTCIWGIDDTGRLFIGEGVPTTVEYGKAPWEAFKPLITEVNTFGEIKMPEGASMEALFKDCKQLVKVNLKDMDTRGVRNMARLFENCESLTELNLSNFDTMDVVDMNHMFSGCKSLTTLDLSNFYTRNANNMTGMFSRCNVLHSVALGDDFSHTGDGTTNCGNMSFRDTGKYRIGKVVSAGSAVVIYNENYGKAGRVEKRSVSGMDYIIDDVMFTNPGKGFVFAGWDTDPDGNGKRYEAGQRLRALDEDLELYAIWIGLPRVGRVATLEEIEFGSPIPFELPEIISEHDDSVSGYLEVSPNGDDGTWHPIERTAILPASYNGYLVRLCARNKVGKTYSNAVRIRIKKATIDISKVRWAESESMTYDGTPKSVWLEGVPEGITVHYQDNEATEVGEYRASVRLEYDTYNYDIPLRIRDHAWSINKAQHDMSSVRWNYDGAFIYDGRPKEVRLTGLPDTVQVSYQGNTAVDAGVMTAIATLTYDGVNFEKPMDVIPCVWEIKKAAIETKQLNWSDCAEFVYDGRAKRVYLTNLPDDVQIEYSGEEEVLAGKYLARATISGNYYATSPIEYEWEIKKASYNMSGVDWTYTEPFKFDKETHSVRLVGIPEGLQVRYYNNVALKAGDYEARASFTSSDTHNYVTPEDRNLVWTITKSVIDMSAVSWNYHEPFTYSGEKKIVELQGLPEGVYAVYENNVASNAGVYNAHATLKYDEENFEVEQPVDCQWQINKAKVDIGNMNWNYYEPFVYDGKEKTITLSNVPEGISVEYKDNAKIDSGKYVASAKLTPIDINNYEVPEINGCTWSISKFKLIRGEILWSDYENFYYDGKEKTVKIISEIDEKIKVEYTGNKQVNAGNYTARVSFFPVDTHNYEAPVDAVYEWQIKKSNFDMKEVIWDYTSAYTYDGKKKSVQLLNVPEGLIVHYENEAQTEAGNYVAVARFEVMNSENFNEVPDMVLNWSIQKATYDMREVRWQEQREFAYSGNASRIELVGLPDGIEPRYFDNEAINAGEYLAEVQFDYDERNYEAPVFSSCRWRITKSDFNPGNARWDYKEPFIYDGAEKSIALIDIPEGAYVEYSNTRGVDAGTYIASADLIAEDSNNFNDISIEGITWKINKGEYDMSYAYWDYDKAFKYDGTEKRVTLKGLPEGVFPVYSGNVATDAGEYTATVSFKIADPNNYNIPASMTLSWVIDKADYDMSIAQWNYSGEFTYTGRMQEVIIRGLPDGVRAIYDGNCATNVGMYTATAKLLPYDEDNYNIPIIADCNWEIVKADFDMSAVRWDYVSAKVFNNRVQVVELENLPNGVFAKYQGNEGINVGRYSAKATLSVADAANYNIPSINGCEWDIVNADIDMSNVLWNYRPELFVYDGKSKSVFLDRLPEGVSATYQGNTAKDAGFYVATAEFEVENPNYRVPESLSFRWEISKATCDISGIRWNYGDEFTYSGAPQGIELVNVPAVLKVAYKNNKAIDVGEYYAVASFLPATDNYEAPEDIGCKWAIGKANIDISKIRWDYDKSFVYDGEQKSIELAGVPSLLNVSYSGNIGERVGKYIAHADLYPVDDHNYNVPAVYDCQWEIIKTNYDMSKAKWVNDGPFEYDGSTHGVYLEGLPEGVTPAYYDNRGVNAGEYIARAVFEFDSSNYNVPAVPECKWRINKTTYDLSRVEWSNYVPFVYDGSVKEVVLKGLPRGVTPIYTGNRSTEAGTHIASVSFNYDDVNYEKPSFESCKWEIEQGELKINKQELRWNYRGEFVYDGRPKSVALREKEIDVSFMEKIRGMKPVVELIGVPEGVEVYYEDNVHTEVGVYYAKAVLRHKTNRNFKDFIVTPCKWEIVKASLDMSRVRWSYSASFVYDGSEKSVRLLGVPEELVVTYEDNVAVESGSYEARATLELKDPRNYAMPMPIKGCWWQIEKAKYDMSHAMWTYDDDIVYNGKEKTVRVVGLPEGVKVEAYTGNKAIEAGTYTAEAIFKYKNKENFEEPEIPALRWKIQKRKIDTSEMRWTYVDDVSLYVYDGKVKEVKLVGVPKEVEVVYINNSKINAGNYIARARLSYDTKNLEADPAPDCRWSIGKATFDTSKVHWSYEKPFKYDAYEKSITLRNVPSQIDVRYRDNKASAVGTYTAKAYLTYDKDNYNPPEINSTIDWEIVRMADEEENK